MQEQFNEERPPRNMSWLALRSICLCLMSVVYSVVALFSKAVASERGSSEFLSNAYSSMIESSVGYAFAVLAITLLSLLLLDIKYKAYITYFQYVLVGASLTLFYWLLIGFSEFIPFWLSYCIVSLMTAGLIGLFMKGICGTKRPMIVSGLLVLVEYAYILLLLYIGSIALLLGSLAVFALIAMAMYFTLKMKISEDEITIG